MAMKNIICQKEKKYILIKYNIKIGTNHIKYYLLNIENFTNRVI